MAYTTINKSTDYFNTKLYTGTGASSQAQTGVGHAPDFVWIKSRSTSEGHVLADAVRGATKYLISNTTSAEVTNTDTVKSFDSDGYTIGPAGVTGGNGVTFASWNWKANGAGSSNTDGSITSTVSANTTSGFSIVKYTGTGSSGTIGHGLGVPPTAIITKRVSATEQWFTWIQGITSAGGFLKLDVTNAASTNNTAFPWNPQANTFGVSGDAATNSSGLTYIAYCFAEKPGYSKMNSYIGNGNSDGAFIYTGFKPAFLIVKNTAISDNWSMFNNKALGYNTYNHIMYPDLPNTESNGLPIDFLANGFKWRNSAAMANGGSQKHVYMAFAEAPIVGTNNVPANAR